MLNRIDVADVDRAGYCDGASLRMFLLFGWKIPPMTDRKLPQRKSPRLRNYDYSLAGAYFVTICAHQRAFLFGTIQSDEMRLNPLGEIAASCWLALPDHFPHLELDAWVIMPNHMHGILVIWDQDDLHDGGGLDGDEWGEEASGRAVARPYTLGMIINAYKGAVTHRVREHHEDAPFKIWQGRYHDHIIRNERGLNTIRDYVQTNPLRWTQDTFYTE
jgi:REP element-mobilizing transposase RayT